MSEDNAELLETVNVSSSSDQLPNVEVLPALVSSLTVNDSIIESETKDHSALVPNSQHVPSRNSPAYVDPEFSRSNITSNPLPEASLESIAAALQILSAQIRENKSLIQRNVEEVSIQGNDLALMKDSMKIAGLNKTIPLHKPLDQSHHTIHDNQGGNSEVESVYKNVIHHRISEPQLVQSSVMHDVEIPSPYAQGQYLDANNANAPYNAVDLRNRITPEIYMGNEEEKVVIWKSTSVHNEFAKNVVKVKLMVIDQFRDWQSRVKDFLHHIGLQCLSKMKHWEVPNSHQKWTVWDNECRSGAIYKYLRARLARSGAIDYSKLLNFTTETWNMVYLAHIDTYQGLESLVASTLYNSINMEECKLPQHERHTDQSGRRQYFEVFRVLMVNTVAIRSRRFQAFMKLKPRQSEAPRRFLDRLITFQRESNVLHSCAKNSNDKSFQISKDHVSQIFVQGMLTSNQSPADLRMQYQTITNSMEFGSNEIIDADFICPKFQSIYENHKISNETYATSFMAKPDVGKLLKSSRSNTDETSLLLKSDKKHDRRKKKLIKDSLGNLICFQYAKSGECRFGDECKYSHSCNREKVLAAFSSKECDDRMIAQVHDTVYSIVKKGLKHKYDLKYSKKKWKPKLSKKSKDSANAATSDSVKSPRTTNVVPKITIQRSMNQAIENHHKRELHKKQVDFANVVDIDENEIQHDREQSDCPEYSSSSSSDDRFSTSSSNSSSCESANLVISSTTSNLNEFSLVSSKLFKTFAKPKSDNGVIYANPKDHFLNSKRSLASSSDLTSESITESSGILDSGATVHLTGNIQHFVGPMRECNVRVRCANNQIMVAQQCGDVLLLVHGNRIWLKDVLHLPGSPMLISVGRLVEDGTMATLFQFHWCKLFLGNTEITTIYRLVDDTTDKLYHLRFRLPKKVKSMLGPKSVRAESVFIGSTRPTYHSISLLHNRYAHASEFYLQKLDPKCSGTLQPCEACAVGGLVLPKFSKTTLYSKCSNNDVYSDQYVALKSKFKNTGSDSKSGNASRVLQQLNS